MRAPESIPPNSPLEKELAYLHERIDQLIRQTAAEVATLECQTNPFLIQTDRIRLAQNRFQTADDAAAETCAACPRGGQRFCAEPDDGRRPLR